MSQGVWALIGVTIGAILTGVFQLRDAGTAVSSQP